jgi:hypothetical protein
MMQDTDVGNTAAPVHGIYLVRGFPLKCNADPITLTTFLYDEHPHINSEFPLDSSYHILLDHTQELHRQEGLVFQSPKIAGVSGCGIWRITTRTPMNLTGWAAFERRLVAIQVKCKHGSYLKGTWIRHAFDLIYRQCPELCTVMSILYFPRTV